MNGELKICQCGREIGPRAHCPVCGSMKSYPLLKQMDTVTRPDGSKVDLRVWRCTRCTHRFNDDDWMLRCQAPAERFGRTPRRKPPVASPAVDKPAMLQDPEVHAVLQRFFEERVAKERAEHKAGETEDNQ